MDDVGEAYSIIKLTSSKRPDDRFIGVTAEKIDWRGRQLLVVSVVEIANRWNPAIELGSNLIQTFVRTFSRSQNRSVLTKFEDALKGLNHFLSVNKEKFDEKIDCAIAILADRELYFSTINNGHFLLWRSQKFSQITGTESAGNRFTTVTSGDLQVEDCLVAASQQLRDLLKTADDKVWLGKNRAKALQQLIEPVPPADRPGLVGVFLEPSSEDQTETIDTAQLDSRLPLKLPSVNLPTDRISSASAAVGGVFTGLLTQAKSWLGKISLPRLKKPANNESNELPMAADEYTDELPDEPIAETPRQRRSFRYSRLLAPILFVALLVVGIILIRGEFRRVSTPPKVSVPTISDLVVKTAPSDLFAFIDQNLTVDNYKNLSAKQQTQFTQALAAQNIGLVLPSAKVIDVANPVVAMDNTSDSLFLIDATGQLWRYQASLTKVTQQSLIQNPVSITALSDSKVLVSDQSGAIWLFDGSSSQPTSLTLPTGLAQGEKLLGKYGSSNLYLYQSSSQTIYKVGGFIHDIGDPAATITSSVLSFGTFDDWTIPSDFIGATDSGSIKNFTKSKVESLAIQYYPDTTPIRISLTNTDGQLAVARGKYVTVYTTADGKKISEKALVTDSPISDISPGPNNTFWVAAGKSLYKL